MHVAALAEEDDFEGWRDSARRLAVAGVAPGQVSWRVGAEPGDLFGGGEAALPAVSGPAFSVPKAFVTLAELVICHSEPERFALLYTLLCRIRGNAKALEDKADPLVQRLERMAKEVRRDIHKMHAFVRFRAVMADEEAEPCYVAWFEPEHPVVERATPFFARRFAAMRWSILTPERCAHWDGEALEFTPGLPHSAAPDADELEELWRTYYAHTFNPARLRPSAMRAEMPKRYWRNLPEAAVIPELVHGAPGRVRRMIDAARPDAPDPVRPAN